MIANCRTTVDLLPAWVDGCLRPEEAQAVHAHVAVCPRCVEFMTSYRETSRVIREATDVELPADVERRLLDVLDDRLRSRDD